MKLFYVYTHDISNPSIGVLNKIEQQARCFEKSGFEVVKVNMFRNKSVFERLLNRITFWGNTSNYKNLISDFATVKNSIIYIRFALFDFYAWKLLRMCRKNNNFIVIEFPTYPFKKEINFRSKQFYYQHLMYLQFVRKYIDFFVTYSEDNKIYNIDSIPITNGIDLSVYRVKTKCAFEDELHLLVVATLALWHGVDRVIKGLAEYVCKGGKEKVYLHVVGEGRELKHLKELVIAGGLEKYVFFYGTLKGKQLDDLFDKIHLGIGSLGCHRINIYSASILKSREYCARALPFFISVKLSDFPDDFKYVKYIPADESPVNIDDIIAFARVVYLNEDMQQEMRSWAENNLSWERKMLPVIQRIKCDFQSK